MRKASTWTTVRYHLGALVRSVRIWLGDFRVSCQDWSESNLVAPEAKRYGKPDIHISFEAKLPKVAVPLPYESGCGPVCLNGDQSEIWITGLTYEATAEAYLCHIGIRWVEEVSR